MSLALIPVLSERGAQRTLPALGQREGLDSPVHKPSRLLLKEYRPIQPLKSPKRILPPKIKNNGLSIPLESTPKTRVQVMVSRPSRGKSSDRNTGGEEDRSTVCTSLGSITIPKVHRCSTETSLLSTSHPPSPILPAISSNADLKPSKPSCRSISPSKAAKNMKFIVKNINERSSKVREDSQIVKEVRQKLMRIDSNKEKIYFVKHIRSYASQHLAGVDTEKLSNFHKHVHCFLHSSYQAMQKLKDDYILERHPVRPATRRHQDRKVLMLDLDETLIHCSGDLDQWALFEKEVDFINEEGETLKGLVNLRPGVHDFLARMADHYEIWIFTASQRYYAARLVALLDPGRRWISEIHCRERCSKTKSGLLVKDLAQFGLSEEQMVLVDNNPSCLWPQPQCGIPIIPFETDRNDKELACLSKFLISIAKEPHTSVLTDHFKLKVLLENPIHNYLTTIHESAKPK